MSSQDFSPAPLPFIGEDGGGVFSISESRPRERYWLHFALFALTLATTTLVGAAMQYDFRHNQAFNLERTFTTSFYTWLFRNPVELLYGLPFSLTLMTILLAHELGHYFAALYHRVDASLPYFMPSPVLGTFGAFIRVRSPIYSKNALFDIGIAGPLAGFVFLLPALSVGIALSKVIPGIAHQGMVHFGVPGLEWLLAQAIFPGVNMADLSLHPVARAAWVGMFATALNLLPIGQLDGGHILYSFFPGKHRLISRLLCICLLPMGWFWFGWFFWGAVLLWLGRRHPVIYDETNLDARRRKLGWVALVVFLLCFTYAPLTPGL